MKRFLRILKTLGKGLLALTAVLVVALLIMRWVFVRQLNAEIAAIKARGEPLTEAEMAGPPVPDAENAALVYEKAFEALPRGDAFWADMEPIKKAVEHGDTASLREAHRMIGKYDRAMAVAKQAIQMPRCTFPANSTAKFADSPGYKLRRLSLLSLHYASLHARSGSVDEAVDDVTTSLAISNELPVDDGSSSAVTREAMIVCACTEVRKIAQDGRISGQQAHKLYEQFSKIDMRAIHKRSLQGERAYLLSIDHSDPVTWVRKRGGRVSTWDAFWSRVNPIDLAWRHVILIGDQAALLDLFEKLIGVDCMTYAEARSLQRDAEWNIPFYAILTKILAPVHARTLDSLFRAETHVRGSQAFLALLAYRDSDGAYPPSLSELRRGLGWAIPKDPFSGEEFIYKRKGKGFVLYSVGPDMQDNNGKPQPTGKAYREGAEYDIAWDMEH